MSRGPALAAFALVAALVVLLTFVLWRPTETESPGGASAEHAVLEVDSAVPLTGASGPVEAASESVPTLTTTEEARPERAPALGWIHGHVELPEGTPPDEPFHVDIDGRELGVDAAGRFRVANPDATQRLQLRGRYLYMEDVVVDTELDEIVLRPKLGARIAGSLVLSERARASTASAVGARVLLGGRESFETELDTDLHFELGPVPAGSFMLVIQAAGFTPIYTDLRLVPGQTHVVTRRLELGAEIRGVLRNEQGAPRRRAAFTVKSGGGDLTRSFTTSTWPANVQPDGSFVLRDLPSGAISLRVEAEGHLPTEWGPEDLAEGEVREGVELILRQGDGIHGRVVWADGRPVPGCRVEAQPVTGSHTSKKHVWDARTESKADGTFELVGLIPADWILIAQGRDDGAEYLVRLDDVPTGTRDLVITLGAGHVLHGRVVDDEGKPVQDFEVAARPRESYRLTNMGSWHKASRRSFHDEQGLFAFDGLPEGDWDLRAQAEGLAPAVVLRQRVPATSDRLEFVLPRMARIEGRVLAPDGAPSEGASVQGVSSRDKVAPAEVDPVKTEGDGSYSLAVQPGSVGVRASAADGNARSRVQRFALSPGETRGGVVLRLEEVGVGRVTGSAVDAAGKPATWRKVVLQGNRFHEQAESDGQGGFEFVGVPAGSYAVALQDEPRSDAGGRYIRAEIEVAADETTHVVLGAPRSDTVRVTGRVLRGSEPVPDVEVSAFAGAFGDSARTDSAGTFDLALPAEREYSFAVRSGSSRSTTRAYVPASPPFSIDFELGSATISGVVLGPAGGPTGNVSVGATQLVEDGERISSGWMMTGPDGSFSLGDLASGTYRVTARTGQQDTRGLGTTQTQVEVRGTGIDDLVLRLPRAGRLEGRVFDTAGRAAAAARVLVFDADGHRAWNTLNILADSSGHFVADISPGSYSVCARSDTAAPTVPVPVDVEAGGSSFVELHLQPGGFLTVSFDPADAPPMPVHVLDHEGRNHGFSRESPPLSDRSLRNLWTSFGPLAPGEYVVTAGDAEARAVVEPGRETEVVLRLAQ